MEEIKTKRQTAIELITQHPGMTAPELNQISGIRITGELTFGFRSGKLIRRRKKTATNPYLGLWAYYPNPNYKEKIFPRYSDEVDFSKCQIAQ